MHTGQHVFGYPDERSDHNTGCETSNSSDCRDSRSEKNKEVKNEPYCEQSDERMPPARESSHQQDRRGEME